MIVSVQQDLVVTRSDFVKQNAIITKESDLNGCENLIDNVNIINQFQFQFIRVDIKVQKQNSYTDEGPIVVGPRICRNMLNSILQTTSDDYFGAYVSD